MIIYLKIIIFLFIFLIYKKKKNKEMFNTNDFNLENGLEQLQGDISDQQKQLDNLIIKLFEQQKDLETLEEDIFNPIITGDFIPKCINTDTSKNDTSFEYCSENIKNRYAKNVRYQIGKIKTNTLSTGTKSGVIKKFPAEWGDPPERQTKDLIKLPAGYGFGSSTLFEWINTMTLLYDSTPQTTLAGTTLPPTTTVPQPTTTFPQPTTTVALIKGKKEKNYIYQRSNINDNKIFLLYNMDFVIGDKIKIGNHNYTIVGITNISHFQNPNTNNENPNIELQIDPALMENIKKDTEVKYYTIQDKKIEFQITKKNNNPYKNVDVNMFRIIDKPV